MRIFHFHLVTLALLSAFIGGCAQPANYDLILRKGTVYDGLGAAPLTADIGINDDTIAAIGDLSQAVGKEEFDLSTMAVAPGFINMLSWATVSLIEDGRSQGDIRQGVTLEVMGEGSSMGPLNDSLKREMLEGQGDIKYDIEWTTLGEYLDYLVRRGVSTNIASFVGNGTLRQHVIGYENRPASAAEMQEMKSLLRQGMEEGAVGMSSALIYVPSSYAQTEELIELAQVVAEYNGMYVSHIRDEGKLLLDAIDELVRIAEEAGIAAEIYHLKASGEANWTKLDSAIERIEGARSRGLAITADMYTYPASSTGLNVTMPRWAREGGHEATISRLKDPKIRAQIESEMDWNTPPERILLVGFKNPDLRHLIGKTLAEVAKGRSITPETAVGDLILEDDSRIQVVYFSMSEENIKKKIRQPWMSICSDAGSMSTEGVFLKQSTHPRAYGSFARVLGKYARDEGVISLEEGIRRLTSLPASNLKIKRRGSLKVGNYADVVVFDPGEIRDNATFEKPHQYATGVEHVWVNGEQVIKDGEHTGATPGRVVRGPGWVGRN